MPPNGGMLDNLDDIDVVRKMSEGEWRMLLLGEVRSVRRVAREEAWKVQDECFKRNLAIVGAVSAIISTLIGLIAVVI